jgi:hypothetical protein
MPNEGRYLKHIDKPAGSERQTEASEPNLDLKRRRFIRGAAGVAPVVLTLRSGAVVAAASCTGAKRITTLQEQPGGNFQIAGGTGDLQNGDRCFTSPTVCPTGQKISEGNSNGTVRVTGPNARCEGGTYSNGQQVAILSSTAAQSLTGIA